MSRLATIGDASGTYAGYKYLGANRIVVEDYEDIDVRLDYTADEFAAFDRFGWVLDQVWTDYGEEPDVVLDHYSYTYDRAGNRTSRGNELHSAFDEDYTYDNLDRLTDADRADTFDQSWGLDGLGNFGIFDDDGSSQTRTVNEANEIQNITGGWITPAYDAAGNMASGPAPGDETTRVHYTYDAWNRLVAVKADNSGEPGNTLGEYEYDGTNRRIDKIVTAEGGGPSHVHYFYNNDWQMLEEVFVDGQGQTSASNEYVWSSRYIDAPIVRFHDANGDGDLLDAGDNTRYYTGDANSNVTATIDAATGDIVERYVYTAYGQATVYDQNWSSPMAPTKDGPLYCGYFFDAETELYHVRNRYYDSGLSTFISRDPVGYDAGDGNLYRYVGNGPTNVTDPTGLVEADDRNNAPGNVNLVDIDRQLETIINAAINRARQAIRASKTPVENPGRAMADLVYDQLGRDKPGSGISTLVGEVSLLTRLEVSLSQTLSAAKNEINDIPFAQSCYGNTPVGLRRGPYPGFYTRAAAEHMLSPTISVKTVLMGTDKWGHFVQQGYWLYRARLENRLFSDEEINEFSRWLEGDPNLRLEVDRAREDRFKRVALMYSGGTVTRFGYFGSYSTGVVSFADVEANRLGYEFYKALEADPWNYRFSTARYAVEELRKLNEFRNPNFYSPGVKVQ